MMRVSKINSIICRSFLALCISPLCTHLFAQSTFDITNPNYWKGNVGGFAFYTGSTPGNVCNQVKGWYEGNYPPYYLPPGYSEYCLDGGTVSYTFSTNIVDGNCEIEGVTNVCGTLQEPGVAGVSPLTIDCPSGYYSNSGMCISNTYAAPSPSDNAGEPEDCPPGNPINPANGNKYQTEIDYKSGTVESLNISRTYNSAEGPVYTIGNGERWHNGFDLIARVSFVYFLDHTTNEIEQGISSIKLYRGHGGSLSFTPTFDENDEPVWSFSLRGRRNSLETAVYDNTNNTVTYYSETGAKEVFTMPASSGEEEYIDGKVTSITYLSGSVSSFTYDSSERLSAVTQVPGADYAFTYDGSDRVDSITTPGGTIEYTYDSSGNLETVTYPDSTTRTYHYENTTFIHALTGITDENGNRFSTYGYDSLERAILTKHAGDVNMYTFDYVSEGETDVTDPLNETITYNHENIAGRWLRSEVSNLSSTCSSTALQKYFDPDAGKVTTEIDGNGYGKNYEYTNDGHTVSITNDLYEEIIYNYIDAARLDNIISGGTEIDYQYDTNNRLETKTIRDLNTSAEKTWTYSYNTEGRVSSINGPRTDITDTTSFTYFSSGDLNTITNALSQTTTFGNYTGDGRVGMITYPTGGVTNITYTNRGWVNTVTTQGMVTYFDYDNVGNLEKVTYPNGSYFEYEYDNAHRLIAIEDYDGNRMEYTLDGAGNRTNTDIFNSMNTQIFAQEQTFNSQGRLYEVIGALNQTTKMLEYDNNGNISGVTYGNSNYITYTYDALNRVDNIYNSDLSVDATISYHANGAVDTVDDFIYESTAHYYDDLYQLTELASPDTGSTLFTYDDASNITEKTDAESRTLQYTYDALNRLTDIEGTSYSVVLGYDEETNSIGQLGSIDDNWGFTKFLFNSIGLLAEKSQTPTGGTTLTAEYSYTSAGDLEEIEYPSGATVSYFYGANRKVDSIKINNVTHLSNIKYQPFGDLLEWDAANSVSYARTYNQDGYVNSITYPDTTRIYDYDDNFNITEIEDSNYSSKTQSMEYDGGDRLASYTRNGVTVEWEYDGNGNRIAETTGTVVKSYYTSGNRVTELYREDLYATEASFTYDSTGNIVSRNSFNYVYNEVSRLIQIVDNSNSTLVADYEYNGIGQRVQKTVNSQTTHFFYDQAGHLLGEYVGSISTEYVWLGDTPVAIIINDGITTAIYYVHPDHLNAPRYLTDSIGAIVWRWDGDAFGRGLADGDPDSNSQDVVMNLRFPGQQFDEETGLHYNYFRYYDPSLGRYLQSDPIGLAGGINTYAYVGG